MSKFVFNESCLNDYYKIDNLFEKAERDVAREKRQLNESYDKSGYILESVKVDIDTLNIEPKSQADKVSGKATIKNKNKNKDLVEEVLPFTYDENGNLIVEYKTNYSKSRKTLIEELLFNQLVSAYTVKKHILEEELDNSQREILISSLPQDIFDYDRYYYSIWIDYIDLDVSDYGQLTVKDYVCDNIVPAEDVLEDVAKFCGLNSEDELTEDICKNLDPVKFNDFLFKTYYGQIYDGLLNDDRLISNLIDDNEERLWGEEADAEYERYRDMRDNYDD